MTAAIALPLATVVSADESTDEVADATGAKLLTEPFLQSPSHREVSVAWFTEDPGSRHVVLTGEVSELTDDELRLLVDTGRVARRGPHKGRGVDARVRVHRAETTVLSRTAEDASSPIDDAPAPEDGIVPRPVHRHEARVRGIHPVRDTSYRVVSVAGDDIVASETYTLADAPRRNEDVTVLLTSDHQQKNNTPANLQWASEVLDDIDAVFFAGDLVNVPDRASEWFDANHELAFFPGLQGTADFEASNGRTYHGAPILQNAPIYPAIGNHEVQGRIEDATSLGASFNSPVPIDVAEAEYEKVRDEVNPTDDPDVKDAWIENNSFSTRTYEEIFSLPDDSPGGERYYAATVGNIRLISLYSTRIWRPTTAQPDPAARDRISRYQESADVLDEPLQQGYGEHIFESLAVGSEQYTWLRDELASADTRRAEHVVVMLHEGPQGLGDNTMPHFAHPVRIEETDESGDVIGVRYEYPPEGNFLLNDLQPLLEDAGVDLVHNGHSHLWNRFTSESGTHYLETSNVGNSYGAFHPLSGRSRPVPPEPWDADNYVAQGNPGGLEPRVPTVAPFTNEDGAELPFVQSNRYTVFSALDSGAGTVTSYAFDTENPDTPPWVFDRFRLD